TGQFQTPLHPTLVAEYQDIKAKLTAKSDMAAQKPPKPLDLEPLYKALQAELKKIGLVVEDHLDGGVPSQQTGAGFAALSKAPAEMLLAAAYGILLRDRQQDAPVLVSLSGNSVATYSTTASPDPNRPDDYQRFSKTLSVALGEYNANQDLFAKVLPILIKAGDTDSFRRGGQPNNVFAEQWASVVKALVSRGVTALDPQLSLKTQQVLDTVVGGEDGLPSNIIID